jgi:hypothetical protein
MKKYITIYFLIFSAYLSGQIPTDDLVGYWSFDGNANEIIKGNNSGFIDGATLTEDRCGITNSAFLFDGIDDSILCSENNMGIVDEVSISCWVKKENPGTDIVISKYEIEVGYNIQFDDYGSPQIRGRDGNAGFLQSGNNKVSICDNEWHHIVGIVDGPVWKVYVDTILIGSYDSGNSTNNVGGSTSPLVFGRRSYFEQSLNTWNSYKGVLDDIAIYNRAISESEIALLYLNDCGDLPEVNDCSDMVEFNVYPNPAVDGVVIFKSNKLIKRIKVFDVLGRQINADVNHNLKEGSIIFNTNVAGTYFLQIEFCSSIIVKKMVYL